jgi:hypothetical protein
MKLPLKSNGQWPQTISKKKVVLVHSDGPQNNDKVKNRPTKWQFSHENHQLGKVVKMKGTDSSARLLK